jgi:hypothetical protein
VSRFLADLKLSKSAAKEVAVKAKSVLGPKWIPPPDGLVKINVDAATSKNSAKSAIAAVVRGEDGAFLGASSAVLEGISNPEILEALACREGMTVAADLLVQKFRLASDCSNVIRSISEPCFGGYGHVIQEIVARAASFREVQFVYEGRSANVDAHNLARSSIYLEVGRHSLFLSPPDGVCMNYSVS